MNNYNAMDIIILLIIFSSIIIGLLRGLISEVVSLITLIAAFAVAIYFTSPLVAKFTSTATVQHMVSQTSNSMGVNTAQPVSYMAFALCFAVLFVATLLAGLIIRALINVAFATGVVGIGNRIFGGVFGFVRGILIAIVIIFLIQLSPLSSESWWQQSKLVPQFRPAIAWLGNIVSPTLANIKAKLGSSMENLTGGGSANTAPTTSTAPTNNTTNTTNKNKSK